VDDGPATVEDSLEMIRCMEEDGVTHVIATPHCNQNLPWFRGDLPPLVADLNAIITQQGFAVTVLPGSEVSFYDAAVYRDNYLNNRYCHLGDRREYSLLEFPWKRHNVPRNAVEHVAWIVEQGTTPIIAHPERTPFLRDHPRVLSAIYETGAWLQLTVDSVVGNNSPQSLKMADTILRTYERVVLASDSHGLHRCSGLSVGYDAVAARFGDERAQDLYDRAETVAQSILG
jgi:protein-tyrosine phosphatase